MSSTGSLLMDMAMFYAVEPNCAFPRRQLRQTDLGMVMVHLAATGRSGNRHKGFPPRLSPPRCAEGDVLGRRPRRLPTTPTFDLNCIGWWGKAGSLVSMACCTRSATSNPSASVVRGSSTPKQPPSHWLITSMSRTTASRRSGPSDAARHRMPPELQFPQCVAPAGFE